MGMPGSVNVVARYFEMWNTGDTSSVHEIVAPTWIDHGHPEVTGPESVALAVSTERAARADLRFEIEAILGGDGLVTATGSLGGSRLNWVVRLQDGLMAEMHTYREEAT
jgi:ketosteroid isomerase-like protein